MLALGVDVGTTSVCAVLYDTRTKIPLKILNSPNNAVIERDFFWQNLQEPDVVVGIVQMLLEEICQGACPDVIGITGQMHGVLYVDKLGRAVSSLYTWKDGRGDLTKDQEETWAQVLSRETGYPIYSGYGICTHYWLEQNGKLPYRAESFCTIGDYVAMRLTQSTSPLMDSSNMASIGGYDLAKGRIDRAAFEGIISNMSMLPAQVESGTEIGRTRHGTPVLCAIGDNQASFLGAVAQPKRTIFANVGTGSQVSVWSSDLLPDAKTDVRPFLDRGYLYVAASLNGGAVLHNLAKFFVEVAQDFELGVPVDVYQRLDSMAEGDVVPWKVKPDLYGARGSEKAGGYMAGMTSDNFSPSAFVSGFYDGMADELASLVTALPNVLLQDKDSIVGAGNGLRKNAPLVRRLEERMQMKLRLCPYTEEAAVGAAKYAAEAIG